MTSHPPCPHCGSNRVAIQETRKNLDGSTRRRMHCNACLGSFSQKTAATVVVSRALRSTTPVPEEVRQALAAAPADVTHNALARQYGISRDSVKRFRGDRIAPPESRQLTKAEAEAVVLASPSITNAELARRYGVSRESIRNVRIGRTHRDVRRPVRHADRTCTGCAHWWAAHCMCSFEFPESVIDGPEFATECELYAAS